MPTYATAYVYLAQTALASTVLLAVAAAAVLLLREPARRVRAIELAFAGLVAVPLLMLLPGYPRLRVLPAEAIEQVAGAHQIIPTPSLSLETPQSGSQPPALRLAGELDPEMFLPSTLPAALPIANNESANNNISGEFDAGSEPFGAAPIPAVAPEPTIAPAPAFAVSVTPAISPAQPTKYALTLRERWPALADFRFWIVLVYGVGVAALAAWSLVGLIGVRRLLRSARPVEGACRAMLRDVAGPASDHVKLLVSARVSQPCAFASLPPTIVLPEELCAAGDARRLRWALAHEWSHVARHDVWVWSVSGVLRGFYFYQPLAWWLRRRLQLGQDFVADAASAGGEPEDYAEFLASWSSPFRFTRGAAGLGIGGRVSDLHRRVVMLVENRRPLEIAAPRTWSLAALMIAGLLFAVVACLGPQSSGTEPKPQPQAAASAETTVGEGGLSKPFDPYAPPADAAAESPLQPQTSGTAAQPARDPSKVGKGDHLKIEVMSNLPDSGAVRLLVPPTFSAVVDSEGNVSLGGHYQRALAAGNGFDMLEKRIAESLRTGVERDINLQRDSDQDAKVPVGPVQINARVLLLMASPEAAGGARFGGPNPVQAAVAARPKGIAPRDVLHIDCPQVKPSDGLPDVGVVEPDGGLPLGARFGRVNVLGKSLSDAEQLIKAALQEEYKECDVQVTYAQLNYVPGPATQSAPVAPAQADARVRQLEGVLEGLKKEIESLKKPGTPERKTSSGNQGAEPPTLHLSLRHKETGEPVLYLDDQPTDESSLSRLLFTARERDPHVFLAADKETPYTEVVRLIDLLGSLGLHKISLDVGPRPQRYKAR
jgi:beta-lactamase regulating signal transducer with metallopeptidase domain/protein involved in polysaccharide export with SLBB domain